jgi:hypothetical protein
LPRARCYLMIPMKKMRTWKQPLNVHVFLSVEFGMHRHTAKDFFR